MKKYLLILLAFCLVLFSACGGEKTNNVKTEISTVQKNTEVAVSKDLVTKVPIIMYHYVRDVDEKKDGLGWRLSINPRDFEKQMKYLKDNGYTTLHLSDLIAGKVPKKSIVLSFDDGLEDFYTTALPILQKYGFTASDAVITGMVGAHEHMTKEQIKACIEVGIEITSHTKSHLDMSKISGAELLAQVVDARDFLKNNFDIEPMAFVYPSGKYNDAAIKILQQNGYKIALTTHEGEADLSKDNMLTLPRLRIDNREGFIGFKNVLEKISAEK